MDDAEMEWLQRKDPASCAVWEWLKGDCQKRDSSSVRVLSEREIEVVASRLGIDSPRFSQVSQNLQSVSWIENGHLNGWEKWQDVGRTTGEDALRKQVEYWKKQAGKQHVAEVAIAVLPVPPETSQFSPLRGEERRLDKEVQAAPKIQKQPPESVQEFHDSFVNASGRASKLNSGIVKLWKKLKEEGYTPEDVDVLVRWVKRRNAGQPDKQYHIAVGADLFKDLVKFDSRLGEARAWDRNRPKPPTPRETALRELRPVVCEQDGPDNIKTAADIMPELMQTVAAARR